MEESRDIMKIYIAGPYTPNSKEKGNSLVVETAQNVHRAIRIGTALIKKGHYPFIPHLLHYLSVHPSCNHYYGQDWFYKYDNTFIRNWADAMFYIEDSKGAKREKELAKKMGLDIYYDLEEVPNRKRKKGVHQKKLDPYLF